SRSGGTASSSASSSTRAPATRTTTRRRSGPSPRPTRFRRCRRISRSPPCRSACSSRTTLQRRGDQVRRTSVVLVIAVLALVAVAHPWSRTPPPRAHAVDVYINITGGGAKKLNIAVPEFTVLGGTDTAGLGKLLASVAG